MTIRRLHLYLSVIGLMMGMACQSTRTIPDTVFLALEGADRIDVTTTSKQIKTIVQTWQIRKVARVLHQYAAGWQKPLSGSPLPPLVIDFRKGPNHLEKFGIGQDFLTMGEGQLWFQSLTTKDRDDLLKYLALEERTSGTDRP